MYNQEQKYLAQIVKGRLRKRKKEIYRGENLNPYYTKGQYPTELMDILSKEKELDKIIKA